MHPPETPREHFDYFHELVLYAIPPSPKWAVGEQAARLWIDYHEQAEPNTAMLIELIQVLMPYRFAGSGFYSLWQTVINSFRNLSVQEQVPLWRTIFSAAHQGERALPNNARAEKVLQHWSAIAEEHPAQEIAHIRLEELAKTFGPDLQTAYEWIALAYAIQAWFEHYDILPPFLEVLINQHNALIKNERPVRKERE